MDEVSDETANKLFGKSGELGLFFVKLPKNGSFGPSPPLYWVRKDKEEDAESYHRRCLGLKHIRDQPMVFRKGAGSDIGFFKLPADQQETRSAVVDLHGVPNSWDQQEITTLLTSPEWQDPQILSRKRLGKKWCWRVRRTAPKEVADQGMAILGS